jgi:ubiquinone/menaquinone biosynthesis C-methylase UbiE
MIKRINELFTNRRAKKIANFIWPLLSKGDKVLDFGCGNLLVAEFIQGNLDVEIIGVDVIDINLTSLPLKIYDGERIPFEDKYFDVTYAVFVFHHTDRIDSLFSECIRVTKRRIIVLEDVYENNLELWITKVLDYSNKLIYPEISILLNFRKEAKWIELFDKFQLRDVKVKKIRPVLLRPTRHRLFVLDLKKE